MSINDHIFAYPIKILAFAIWIYLFTEMWTEHKTLCQTALYH